MSGAIAKIAVFLFFWPKNGTFGLKKVVTNAVLPLNYDFIITNSLPEVVVAFRRREGEEDKVHF